ncbi:MAG TPA: hypothetical protein VFS21_27955, partial [Roseiflexaceae bacterium]|nr:hypothetical protein [Roseiflexaceae bacterium]
PDPPLTRVEHGAGTLLHAGAPLAEVQYQLVFPEGAAYLTPQADQAPAVLQAFLRGDALALRLTGGREVPLRLTEQHLGGHWSAALVLASGEGTNLHRLSLIE